MIVDITTLPINTEYNKPTKTNDKHHHNTINSLLKSKRKKVEIYESINDNDEVNDELLLLDEKQQKTTEEIKHSMTSKIIQVFLKNTIFCLIFHQYVYIFISLIFMYMDI